MKKVAIYAVAAVALALLALPAVLGMLTESQVKARIASSVFAPSYFLQTSMLVQVVAATW